MLTFKAIPLVSHIMALKLSPSEVIKRIRDIRKSKNLSMRVISKKIGITEAALSYIERSENSLSLAKLIDIAYALEVEPWQFFVDENHNVGFEFVEPIEKILVCNFRKIPTREKKRIVFDVVEGLST